MPGLVRRRFGGTGLARFSHALRLATSWIVWPAPEKEFALRPFAWNELLVKVEGKRVRTYLNGEEMIDFTYPKPLTADGVLALQIHPGGGARVRFKDIWVRDLTRR